MSPTTTLDGVSDEENRMGLVLLPIGPVVSSVTVPGVAMLGYPYRSLLTAMPPLPAVMLILPPSPYKAGSYEPSKTTWPAPLDDCTTSKLTPEVAVGSAAAKVILPVCELSPMVIVPVGLVLICANSVLLRFRPGLVAS